MALTFRQKLLTYLIYNVSSQCFFICEFSDSKPAFDNKQNNKSYSASQRVATWYDARKECLRLGGDLTSIANLQTILNWSWLRMNQTYWIGLHQNMWIWNSTGAAITYTNWKDGYPDEASSDNQCVCINPQCRKENSGTICYNDRKWRTCNCNLSYAIICQKHEEIVVAEQMLPSTSTDLKFSASYPGDTSANSERLMPSALSMSTTETSTESTSSETISTRIYPAIGTTPPAIATTTSIETPIATTITTATTTTKTSIATTPTTATTTATTPPFKPIISTVATHAATTADDTVVEIDRKTVSSSSVTQNPSNHFAENQATAFASPSTGLFSPLSLLIPLPLVAVVLIVAAVVLIIRKRKYDRRNEASPMTNTNQSETVSPVYATVVKVNRPSQGTVPPGNTIYTDVEMIQRPTPSNSPIYANVQPNIEADDMGKNVVYADLDFPRSADKITACSSPIYSQPYEQPTSDSNTEYAEPFKPDKRPTATAPVINHHHAAGDQHNIYSLAKAIPLGDPNAIYSEPNEPSESSMQTGKPDPIYLNAIDVNMEL